VKGTELSHLLLIEDNVGDARLLREMFNEESSPTTELTHVVSLREAERYLAERAVDIILLDLGLPDAQGLSAVRRAQAAAPGVPLVVLTGLDDESTATLALQEGAQDYLIKGQIETRSLLRALRYAIERKLMEEALSVEKEQVRRSLVYLTASEQRYRTLLESAKDAIAVLTPDGIVREMNQRWVEILGLPPEQLVGHQVRDFVPNGENDENARTFDRAIVSHAPRSEPVEIATADGSNVLMELSNTTIDVAGEQLVLTIGRDVTERYQLEKQLRQAQKLEVLGQLSGGVAHDFNNLLTVILGASDILLTDLGPDDPSRAEVLEIKKAGGRAAGLTRQLLAFSRKQVLQPTVLDINALIVGMEPMLRRLVATHVDLVVSLGIEVGAIKIDATQLEQLVVNLVVNAADAMPRGGKLTVETSNVTLDQHYRKHHLPVVPGDYVVLAVSDTGVGMDEATSQRLFEPFFTTKEVGKGTGLGLATVYGIVKQSGGDIWVYSEPGRGSAFKIYLPQVTTAAVAAAVKLSRAPQVARGGSETILLVEDDEAVRRLARLSLERSGYNVVEAENPKEALKVAGQFSGQIDLLLSDVIMPESEGLPLFQRLVEVRPGLRVLYMSGYADEAVVRHGIVVEGTPFLQKPFTPLALSGKVRAILDAR
jgi:two-component system cell cycle sensor histidine kinase/response regulator CckA